MALYFNNLDEFIKDVKDYANVLNGSSTIVNGKPTIQLIGIDGNPTDDDSVLGSRQKIFEHFEKLYEAYIQEANKPSLNDFHDMNTMALITRSAGYRKAFEHFEDLFDEMVENTKSIDELIEQEKNGVPVDINDAREILNVMYDMTLQMKRYYEVAYNLSITARLMNMIIGYTKKGREFFNDASYFEDTFSNMLEQMSKIIDLYRRMLKYNANCDFVSEMRTDFKVI